ncbi:6,7-dimethyl-8-ribityllumazine synthase [Quillaja saponaria]|uniref:6,7-dimethyl-8-ribityllumazine synthase n=1 Tax=Quillaja saponaria TaxID=32244 RepID=A0AAD7VJP5_QUISA|nr:6,7-dimethyl-8-ribityllumazine synthase [Quillaja saponaria]
MGLVSTENGVLKLVHPGGFVELHNNPVTAAEVMKKNPRHCVTRPDVFKFPWIVARPESVLKPGSVFFIVPCRTVHQLLQSKSNVSRQQGHSVRYHSQQTENCYARHDRSEWTNLKKHQCLKIRHGDHRHLNEQALVDSISIHRGPFYSSDARKREIRLTNEDRLFHRKQVTRLKPCLKKDGSSTGRSHGLRVRFEFPRSG